MTSTTILFKDSNLTWFKSGNGFPLIFLHGFCEDHATWDEFVQPFTEKYTVIQPDNAGFGRSALPETGMTMDQHADAVMAILQEEKITACAMVGHSMGGYITMSFASRFLNYLKGFGLFHSTTYPDDEDQKKDRERVAAFVRKNGAEPFINELYNNLFGSFFTKLHTAKLNELKKYAAKVSPVEGIAAASLAMRDRHETTDVLKQVKVPVLFIIGKEDKAVNLEKTLTLTHLPEASVIHVLTEVGHMGMIEAVDKCRSAIYEWLELLD